MVKGLNLKCKNCSKTFWTEVHLKFGARITKSSVDTLDCFLHEAIFNFDCPYCQNQMAIGTKFFSHKEPKIAQITESQSYIG